MARPVRTRSAAGTRVGAWLGRAVLFALACGALPDAGADDLPEYRLKAAFVYNFMLFTQWPADVGNPLNLCVYGTDPFGKEIDALQGKLAAGRGIVVRRKPAVESLRSCQVVFIAASAIDTLPRVLESLRGLAVLVVADSPGSMHRGVALNMNVARDKVSFEANLQAARAAGLTLSSNLLGLATEVLQ